MRYFLISKVGYCYRQINTLKLSLLASGLDHNLVLHVGEGGGGLPGSRLARRDFIQHLVNLFKSKTLGFGNKEVSVDNAEGAKSTPEEEDAGLHVGIFGTDQVGSDETDDEVPEPVGGSGKGDTTGTDGKREDFTNKNPGTGTPGGGKEEDVDGNESNLGVDSGDVVGDGDTINIVGAVKTNSDTDDSDNEFTDSHTDGTPEKHGATTEAFDKPEGERSGEHVDEGEDEGHEEGVADGASSFQENGRVVEDKVDTSPLLHHLKRDTQESLADVGASETDGTAEAEEPGANVASLGGHALFMFVVGTDFVQFSLDVVRVGVLTTDTAQSLASFLDLSLLDEVTGGFGEEHQTDTKDHSPDHLQSNGDTVRASVFEVFGAVGDAGSEKQTNGDAELVARDDGTTDLLGSNFRHVKNDNCRDETNTETSNGTTNDKKNKTSRGSLEDDTNNEDSATKNDGKATTKVISKVTSDESTAEGTDRENRDDKRCLPRQKFSGIGAADQLDEVVHTLDTTNVSGIVTEEDTSEGGENAHGVSAPCNWGFDTVKVFGGDYTSFGVLFGHD